MDGWLWAIGFIGINLVIAAVLARIRESNKANELVDLLVQIPTQPVFARVDFASFAKLPRPVARYLGLVLSDALNAFFTMPCCRPQASGPSTSSRRDCR